MAARLASCPDKNPENCFLAVVVSASPVIVELLTEPVWTKFTDVPLKFNFKSAVTDGEALKLIFKKLSVPILPITVPDADVAVGFEPPMKLYLASPVKLAIELGLPTM